MLCHIQCIAVIQSHEHLNMHEQMVTYMKKEKDRGRLPSVPWDQTQL